MNDIEREIQELIHLMIEEDDGEESIFDLEYLDADHTKLALLPESLLELKKANVRLREINLNNTKVSNVSLISEFPELKTLYLNSIPATDLSALARLHQLETLTLRNVPINDLTFLSQMTSLKAVFLAGTQVNDLSPLAKCRKLMELNIDDTAIVDLEPLATLSKLRNLSLDRTSIESLSPLFGHKSLSALSAVRTNICDLTPLSGLKQMKRLRLDRTQVSDLKPLSTLEKLKELSLNFCPVGDLKPLSNCQKLIHLYLRKTKVSDITPIAGYKLQDLLLDGSELADITPIKSNRSIQRNHTDNTGLSFRDTPIARLDPDGYGFIANINNCYARTDALYSYFKVTKKDPSGASFKNLELVPIPERPEQIQTLSFVRIKEDLLEIESRPFSDKELEHINIDEFKQRVKAFESAANNIYSDQHFKWCVLDLVNLFDGGSFELDWLEIEIQSHILSDFVQFEQTRKTKEYTQFSNKALALKDFIDQILKRNPHSNNLSACLLKTQINTNDTCLVAAFDSILNTFDLIDFYLFQYRARFLAKHLLHYSQTDWATLAKRILSRNAAIMIGTLANDYMAGAKISSDKSEPSLLWLKANKKALINLSAAEDEQFKKWLLATLSNAEIWIKSGRPLYNPIYPDEDLNSELEDLENKIWCGYYQYFDFPVHF